MTRRSVVPLLVAPALMLVLGGCGGDETPIAGLELAPRGAPDPTTLVQWWISAYEQQDASFLASLIDEAYTSTVPAGALNDLSWLPATFDRAAEVRMADRMFAGIPVVAPDGSGVAPVGDLVVEVADPQGTWSEVPAGRPYAGSLAELFNISILVVREESSAMRTQGFLQFFAAPYDTTIAGEAATWYTLAGLADLTGTARTRSSEDVSWAALRGLWWTAP